MPIREFRCPGCGESVEVILRMDDPSVPACPVCGTPMERRISVPARPMSAGGHRSGGTCCGRETRCDRPPCGDGGTCGR